MERKGNEFLKFSYPTDKTFRVPKGIQGRDIVFQDSPGTASTLRSKHVKVILATVGLAILLMKTCQGRRVSSKKRKKKISICLAFLF